MSPLLCLLLLVFSVAGGDSSSSSCGGDRCGDLVLPFPFHLNSSSSSCISSSNSSSLFLMSCVNGTYLTLSLGGAAFRVIDFSPSGPGNSLLLDYAPDTPAATPCDPAYAPLNSRPSSSSPAAALDAAAAFLAVSPANVLRLYACDDSSLCRAAACDDGPCGGGGNKAGCCYPLSESDGGVWKHGDGLSVFGAFGCRGFSSWVTSSSSSSSAPAGGVVTRRGIEVEWAVPRGSPLAACAGGAAQVNSTGVRGAVRCACVAPGLAGDGFALGTGCTKAAAATCGNGEAGDSSCCQGRFCSKKAVALAGFFVSVFFLAAAVSFWLFLRQPAMSSSSYSRRWDLDPACIPKILAGVSDARQFTNDQLDAATRRFDESEEKGSSSNLQAMDSGNGVRGGVLESGAVVAVQRVGCETPEKLRTILDAMEVSHRNVARVVGFCVLPHDSPGALLLVHESSGNGGTLEEHLRRRAAAKAELGWYHRVSIAVELAGALAHLQHAHGIFLHDLRSSDVFFPGAGEDHTAKIAGHKLLDSSTADYSYYYGADAASAREQDVVRNFGGLLIELLTGIRHQQPLDTVAPKVREGRLHEVLDPALLLSASASGKKQNLNQMLPASGEEVRKVFEIAVRCVELEAGSNGGMGTVARELVEVVRDSMGSSSKIEISLEETFSSSSLLQMISMSPETMHRHLPC